jgi:hypothetical protein
MLRISHCLDNPLTDGGKVVTTMQRMHFITQKHYFPISGTHFCYRLSEPKGHAPLAFRTWIWYTHDGAPAHFSRTVPGVLTARGRPTAWYPRLPDMKPLELYLWAHLNTLVYAPPMTKKRHFTVALWMTVRLSATNRHLSTAEMCRGMCRILCKTMWTLIINAIFQLEVTHKIFPVACWYGHFSCFGMWNTYPKLILTFQLHSVYERWTKRSSSSNLWSITSTRPLLLLIYTTTTYYKSTHEAEWTPFQTHYSQKIWECRESNQEPLGLYPETLTIRPQGRS